MPVSNNAQHRHIRHINQYLLLVAKQASVLHGSVLDANHPVKWVSFGCKSTDRFLLTLKMASPVVTGGGYMTLSGDPL
jgi:hypothetical protein